MALPAFRQHGEKMPLPLGVRRTANHLASGPVFHVRGHQGLTRCHREGGKAPEQRTLHLAQVLGAGHHFLARIAALVETHPTNALEIHHLGNKGFLGRQAYPGYARHHIPQAPDGAIGSLGLDNQLLPPGRSRAFLQHQQKAFFPFQTGHSPPGEAGVGQGFCRGRHALGLEQGGGTLPPQAQNDLIRLFRQHHLGTQYVHFQALDHGGQQIGGHQQVIAPIRQTPKQHTGVNAPLSRAPGGVLKFPFRKVIDVAGELAVEKGLGFFSSGGNQGIGGQRAEIGGGRGNGAAQSGNLAIVGDFATQVGKELMPGRTDHVGLLR